MTRAILAGEPGQRADLALINAGAAIYAAGVAQTLAEGVRAARAAIEDGRATERPGALPAGQPALRARGGGAMSRLHASATEATAR